MDTPLLVFLHGPGQSPPAWQDVVGAINPDQPMVAPWLKGLKPTEHHGFSMDNAVGAVVDLMEARGAEHADLVGYSLGGLVALRTALQYPKKIKHIVLISTPMVPAQAVLSRQLWVARLTPSMFFKDISKEHVVAALEALAESDMWVDLSQLSTPTLVLAADGDPMGRASAEQAASHKCAMKRLLPGTDANLLSTQPALLAQLISDFCGDFLETE
ncbi:MAG: alpha/beta hydrolase [Propionibacteriaceae bacterium]|nr:alpha/beta hydrolase [Propionibacteriaceae bacterium]